MASCRKRNFPNFSFTTQALGGVLFIDEAIRKKKKKHAQIISHGNQESSCMMFDLKDIKTCQNHINCCACFPKTSQAYALVGDDGRDSFGREALDTLIKLVEDWISIHT